MAAEEVRNYSKLARMVRIRRAELGLTVYSAAEKTRISKDTLMKVEDGRSVRDNTYLALEKALGWDPGTCVAILEDVAPEPPGEVEKPARAITEEDISKAILLGIVETTDLPAPQIRAIRDLAIGDLKKRGLL